ncbi:hypothetical protein Tco_1437298 [Tanacetum coccineum]
MRMRGETSSSPREKGAFNDESPDIEQLLGVMECKVDMLMKDTISLMGKSESVFRLATNEMYRPPSEPSFQEEFEYIVMNFVLDQEERIRQLEDYMQAITDEFMEFSSEVTQRLKERIKENENKPRKIRKITRYLDTEDLEPLNDLKLSKTLTKGVPSDTPKIVSPKSLGVKHIRTIFPRPPLVRESTFGFKLGTNTNRNIESRYDAENLNQQITPQVLLSFVENTPSVTYPDEVEEITGIPIELKPLDEIPLEDLGLNTCNHNIPLSSREIPNFDEPKPQPQPLPSCPSLDISLGEERDPEPPIKRLSLNSFKMKVVNLLTSYTPPSPYLASFHPKDTYCDYHLCIGNPKKHYGFKPGLLGHSGSLGVDFVKLKMIDDDWELEFKEVSFLGR